MVLFSPFFGEGVWVIILNSDFFCLYTKSIIAGVFPVFVALVSLVCVVIFVECMV